MENYSGQTLIVADGPDLGASYPLQGTIVTLGRATDNHIVLDSGNISRHHALIRLSAGEATIEDLGSTNGTWVNDRQIFEPQPLVRGDIIRLADYVTYRYVVARYADSTSRMDPDSQRQPIEPRVQEPGYGQPPVASYGQPPVASYGQPPVASYGQPPVANYDQPPARAYDRSDYVEPPLPPPPVLPQEQASASRAPHWGARSPAAAAQRSEPVEKKQPTWLYVVIGLLIILLCLCVASAVYIWFAPREFWDWLFNLFSIPLPDARLIILG
jgi:hypothetical protein